MLERWPFLLIIVLVVGAALLWNYRQRRTYADFFDPAIEHAENELGRLAQRANGSHVPGLKRFRDLIQPFGFRFRMTGGRMGGQGHHSSHLAMPGDGSVGLHREGLRVTVGWIVVALEKRLALLPRVRVDLPLGVTLSALHEVPRPTLIDYWDLWAEAIYIRFDLGPRVRGPRILLTQDEERAFQALTPRACRIFLQASTPADPRTGALPEPYALYVEVWGSPLHGQLSAKPMESDIFAWRDDFRPEDLEELVRLSVQFAKTASAPPT
jgi:hypothetical protein